jgi:ATP-dependent DNA helicase RecQ
MKGQHPITVDRARKAQAAGGRWETIDPVARGRVQVLRLDDDAVGQAIAAVNELRRLASLDFEWNWAEVAVIARDWKYLDPVRAYCEQLGIETQRADEEPPNFWRLRETQVLLGWLDGADRKIVNGQELVRWMGDQPDGPWWALLREAVEQYVLEVTAPEVPVQHFKNWLAEWGREIRRRPTGLMLLSAHRAKGLEFRHVAVLDGSWNRRDSSEDVDAARRLYYVAMTRAQETLTLVRWGHGNALIDSLPNDTCVMQRSIVPPAARRANLLRTYARLSLKNVDLGFAGRHAAAHPVHAAIRALRPGDRVELVSQRDRLELRDGAGRVVGRLAKAYSVPSKCRCTEARVAAIVARRLEDTEPDYRDAVRCDQWEVVVPELVFDVE